MINLLQNFLALYSWVFISDLRKHVQEH